MGFGAIFAAAASLLTAGASPARADEAFRCELKETRGVPPADAETAVGLICEELKRRSGGHGGFEVSLATLGSVVVVSAARLDTAESMSVSVAGIEEVQVAAARIAEALVRREPFVATQRVDNLLEAETRLAPTKKGSVKFALGVADLESLGHGARAAGFSLGLVYSSPRFALPAEMRFAGDDPAYGEPRMSFFSISVGARRYLSRRDASPFVGLGLGMMWLEASEGEFSYEGDPSPGYFQADWQGVAPYLEAGVEVLRLHRGRIALQVRADFPTAALRSEEFEVWSQWDDRTGRAQVKYVYPAQSRYVVPVTIGLNVAF